MMMMRFGLVISLGLCAINSAAVFSAFIPPPSNHADSNIFHLGLVQDPAGGAAALDRNLNPDLSLGLQARGSAPTPADLPPGQVQPDWSSPQNLNDEPANIDQSAGSQDGAATITGENPQYTNPAGSSAPPSSILIADFYQTTPVPDLKGGAAAAFLGVLEVIHQTAAKVVHGMSGVLNPSDEPGLSGEGDAAAATALSLSGDLSLDETEERKIWCPNTRFQGRQLAVCDNGNPRSIWFHVGLDVIMVNEAYLCLFLPSLSFSLVPQKKKSKDIRNSDTAAPYSLGGNRSWSRNLRRFLATILVLRRLGTPLGQRM